VGDGFIGRERESAVLERDWNTPGPGLLLVWGRRRVGKSFLLARFGSGKRTIAYTATQRASALELAEFSERARQVLRPGPRDALTAGSFRSWDEALRYLAAAAEHQRLLVVLDEFTYLLDDDPSLPSVIQRFWDTDAQRSKLHLVLCGSATSVLEGLAEERAPLFGRFSTRLQIHPFSYREAAGFHRGLSDSDRARVYGIVGGTPLYLRMWDERSSIRANLLRLFGDPASSLLNEGELLLRTELPEAAGYFRLMHAVAAGRTKYSEIKDAADIEPARGLDRLISVRLLERLVPVTQDPDRTRVRQYRIADNFLRFWFRFVYPNRGEIERGLGVPIIDMLMLGTPFDNHMGPVFEEMCREFVRHHAGSGGLPAVTRVGRWWTPDGQTEIDVVGLAGKEVVLAGESKWGRRAGRRELLSLKAKVQVLRPETPTTLAVFARDVVEDVADRDVLGFTVEDLYR
jgi:hypothetical protein